MTLAVRIFAAVAILVCVAGAYFTIQMIHRRAAFIAGREFCKRNHGEVFETPDGFACFYGGKIN